MSSPNQIPVGEITVDRDNLYREETFTDLRIASIRRLLPVTADGSPDASRAPIYVGQTQLMSQVGPVPVSCAIEASTLEEAIEKFPEAISQAVERLVDEAREMQRQEASRIVVPGVQPTGKITLG